VTISEAIKELEKVKDKTIQLYSDCPNCGKANQIHKIGDIVVLATTKKAE